MKKLLSTAFALGCLLSLASIVKADTTVDLNVTITPTGTKSISLSTGTLALPSYNLGSVDNLTSSVTVTNDGDLQCILGLRIKTDDPVWSAGTAVGANTYNLRALFNSNAPAAGSFAANDDVLTGSAVQATGTGNVYSGNQDGSSFASGTTRGLWFKLDMPTSSTVSTQRTFVVEVSAN